jgi:Xaa-Pro aminopeptidase
MASNKRRPEPKIIRPDDIDPKHRWDRPLQAPGRTQVDFEERIDFRRLHDYRLARTRAALAQSGLGALLSFDQHNIRYTTSTVIGEWARDKLTRYSLLTGNGDPYIWDFGSAARHHKLYAPWLHQDHCRAGLLGMRGAVGADLTLFRDAAKEIKSILIAEGMANMPVGVDVVEPPMLFALQKEGIEVRDGQQCMLQAREVKNIDELTLLNMAAAMVDGVYTDIAEALKPGVTESQIVGLATKRLYEMGSDCVEAINSISGERCSPHPHNFTDRLIRPGDQAFFDVIQSFMGYRTCYYRTFNVGRATSAQRTAYKKARQWMDQVIDMLKPGMSSDKVAAKLPKAQEAGFANEMDAFGLNFCHGLGLGLHERPLISRLNSFREPIELKAGMVFAVETYCPATDGISAARIEEEVILTPSGAKIISLFPAEELPIANPYAGNFGKSR